jgi:hypothetical protein
MRSPELTVHHRPAPAGAPTTCGETAGVATAAAEDADCLPCREILAERAGISCLACPPGCGSCSKDESCCECYEHQDNHPGAGGGELQ